MRLQKDLTKLKNILLVIDVVLLLAVVASGVLCLFWLAADKLVPNSGYEASMNELEQQEAELDAQIAAANERLNADISYLETEQEDAEYLLAIAQGELNQMQTHHDDLEQMLADVHDPLKMQERIARLRTEYGEAVRQLEDLIMAGESDYKICYLTFDDGPTYQTDKFLDELQELDIYATFFTIGCGIREPHNIHIRDNALRREAREGHTIANHTYTHAYYGPLYRSLESFMDAVVDQDELVYEITGMHTDIVRFPCGSHYSPHREESIEALEEIGMVWMDWIANAMDAGDNGFSSGHIANSIIFQVRHDAISVVLMHDWNLNTLDALEQIVNTLREDNYLFLPLFKESVTNGNCKPRWG